MPKWTREERIRYFFNFWEKPVLTLGTILEWPLIVPYWVVSALV